MHEFSENELLTDLLKSAAKTGISELYLFAVKDRLFITYVQEGVAPRTEVFMGAAGVLRTLRGTMESDGASGSEAAPEQEWCLDLGKAHFDMSTGGMVLVRIIAPHAAGDGPGKPAPAPLPPPDDEEQVMDEEALAAALVTEPADLDEESTPPPSPQDDELVLDEEALAAALVKDEPAEPADPVDRRAPKPPPPPPPTGEVQLLDEEALAAALVNDEPADPVDDAEPPPEDEAPSIDNVVTAVREPARGAFHETTRPVPPFPDEAPSPDNVLTAVHEPVHAFPDRTPGPPPPPPDEDRSIDDALAAVLEPEQDALFKSPKPPPPPPDEVQSFDDVLVPDIEPPPEPTLAEERSLDDVLAAALEPSPEPTTPAPPPAPARRDVAPPPPPPPAEKTPVDRAREMVGAILLGNKPFPSQAVKSIPVHLTVQGRFVPVLYEGGKLWVAVNGPSPVGSLLAQDVGTIEVDAHKLQELLTCYRIDPRHKKR